jgi:hypothetical protein
VGREGDEGEGDDEGSNKPKTRQIDKSYIALRHHPSSTIRFEDLRRGCLRQRRAQEPHHSPSELSDRSANIAWDGTIAPCGPWTQHSFAGCEGFR